MQTVQMLHCLQKLHEYQRPIIDMHGHYDKQ